MIRIVSLYLKDFMSINEANLDFDKHINFIVGNPGTGKSAVFEAIRICLSDEKRSKAYGEYVQQGKDFALIKLKCLINNKEALFDVKLNCVKGTPFEGKLTYDDETYNGSTEISKFIKKLELDYYLKIMFSVQNGPNIVDFSPADRLNHLQKLFDCDFSEQKEIVSNKLKSTKEKISALLAEKTTNETLMTELSIKETKKEFNISKTEYLDTLKILNTKRDKYKELNENSLKVQSLTTEYYKIGSEIDNIKKKIEDIKSLNQKIEKLKEDIATKENERNGLQDGKDHLEKAEAFEKRIEESAQEKNDLQKKLSEILVETSKYNTIQESLLEKKKLIEKGICPECGQPTHDICPDLSDKFKEIEDKLSELNKDNELTRQKITELSGLEVTLNSQMKNEQGMYNGAQIIIKETEAQLNVLLKELSKLEDEQKFANATNDEDVLKLKISEKEKIKEDIQKHKDELGEIDALLDEINTLESSIKIYETVSILNEEIEKRNLEKEERIKKLSERILKIDEESLELQNEVNTYTEAYNIFAKILPQYISKKTCDLLEQNINNFIHTVYPSFDVKLLNTEKGCDLKYTKDRTIVDPKRNDKINSKMSSGFERSVLDLSFKVSLAQSFGLDLFIGDEVDGACGDDYAVELIKEVLNKENFKQIFIISHKPVLVERISEIFEDCNIYETNSGTFKKRNN